MISRNLTMITQHFPKHFPSIFPAFSWHPSRFTTISKTSLGRSPVPSAVATKAPPLEPLKVREAGKAVVVAASICGFPVVFLWFSYGFPMVLIWLWSDFHRFWSDFHRIWCDFHRIWCGFDVVEKKTYRWFVLFYGFYGFDVLKNLAKYLLDGFVTCEQPSEKTTWRIFPQIATSLWPYYHA